MTYNYSGSVVIEIIIVVLQYRIINQSKASINTNIFMSDGNKAYVNKGGNKNIYINLRKLNLIYCVPPDSDAKFED